MKTEIIKMFDSDHKRVQLSNILSRLTSNSLKWSILYFYGIGKAPNNLSMEDFEDVIMSEPTGFKLTWEELLFFSQGIEQTIECLIVAVKFDNDFNTIKFSKDDFSDCQVVIEAFDSTEWRIQIL